MTNKFDPRGEYTKVCPYCRESFIVYHLNRDYCPTKYGRNNFCKNRQKRIMDNIRKSGGVIIENEKNPIKVFIEEPLIDNYNIDQIIKDSQKSKNCCVLGDFLGDKKFIEVTERELLEKGFDSKFFDSSQETKSGIKIYFIGKYWFNKNILNGMIYITLKEYYYGTDGNV